MDPSVARTIWHRTEHVNAVACFSPECRAAPEALGLVGFWMGYFACRAAPLGPVDVVSARSSAAAAALRRLLPDGAADDLATSVLPTLRAAIDAASPTGGCSMRAVP